MEENGPLTMDQMGGNLEASDNVTDCKSINNDAEKNIRKKDLTVESLAKCPEAVVGLAENTSEVNTGCKKKRIKKKVVILDAIQNVDHTELDTVSKEKLAEKKVNGKRKLREKKKAAKNKNDKTQNMGQVDGISNLHLSDVNRGEGIDVEHFGKGCTCQESEILVREESPLSGAMHGKDNSLDMCEDDGSEVSVRNISSLSDLIHGKENPLNLYKETVLLPNVVEVSSNQVSSELVEKRSERVPSPMEVDLKLIPCESQLSDNPNQLAAENLKPENGLNTASDEINVYEGCCSAQGKVIFSAESQLSNHPNQMVAENPKPENGLNEVDDEIIVYEGRCSAQGKSISSTCSVEVTQHLSSSGMNDAECLPNHLGQYPRKPLITSIKRKLIVLDVNGLLASIVMPAPKDFRGDVHILGRAIFRRPFCDDFLKFCFQNFDVGVWSSRSKRIIDRVVEYLLGDLRDKLLFCWDMSHSTQTGFNTLENIHKPLVLKELRRIWENDDPNLPWNNGDYNESNTLLLDDSPYKALLNPFHTAIFPNSFHYMDKNDNSLGPGGDLRVYLEGLLTSEDVRKYVEQHPFGQSAINETNLSWDFYSEVLQTMSNQLQNTTSSPLPTVCFQN